MIELVLILLGLVLGSFVNALVWRLHEQETIREGKSKDKAKLLQAVSIARGRSMCPACHHELAAKDLVPVLSWLSLRGKCRYCQKPISWQYPLVELLTAVLFLVSYLFWPYVWQGLGIYLFVFWLIFMVAFMALAVYDLRWQILPNKIIFPLIVLAIIQVLGQLVFYGGSLGFLLGLLYAVLIDSGIFYVLFQLSRGAWIGGGDVKLGVVLGILATGPFRAVLLLFLASCLGSLASIPLLAAGKRKARISFGPFLLAAAVLVVLFGDSIISWYTRTLLLG